MPPSPASPRLRAVVRVAVLPIALLPIAPLAGCASSAAPAAAASPAPPAVLPFVEDDYASALSQARAGHKLLLVDAWATWCHSCLAMKAYTFRDPKVRAHAGDLVWASIDTEKPANADWVASHPMRSWPTLFIVEPDGGKTILEWPSTATADELLRLIDVARESTRHEGVLAKAETRVLDGNAAAAAGKNDDAIAAWTEALQVAPDGWPGRAATLESLLDRLLAKHDVATCVDLASRELPKIPHGGARAATLALMCAVGTPPGPARRPALDPAIQRVRAMAADQNEVMLADDRSGLFETLVEALQADAHADDAKTVGAQWAAFLEGEAARAPDPASRAVFDAHRVEAYILVGSPERAVPMLEATARDFPGDYNPPARLARAYLEMKRYDDALAAIDRALALVYGPRALRLYATKADVLEAKGDRAAAAATLKDGVARVGSALPPRYAPLLQDLIRRAQTLEATH